MPLNRPAHALTSGPRSVQDARRWAGAVLGDIGRPELVECGQLGVSELVTNALLHGAAPIEVRLRGTREHPRIEVRDASTDAPLLPEPAATSDFDALGADLAGLDDLVLTFGRGLSIVARAATAWGADIEPDGKVVWLVPAADFADDAGTVGQMTGASAPPPVAPALDPITIQVLDVPLRAYAVFQRHLRELRREVRLLALAHESAYPLAEDLSDLFGSLERHLRDVVGTEAISAASAAGCDTTDLSVSMARSATRPFVRFIELLDLADEFCREERLLSLARSPEQHRFQHWLLGEVVRQGEGAEPTVWTELEPVRRTVVS